MKQSSDRIKIHIARKDLLMDDQTYRDILRENFGGATSSKDLTDIQVRQLIRLFQVKGWKPARKGHGKNSRPMASDPQSRKIRALWLTLRDLGALRNASEDALVKYVKRMTGVDALQWLKPYQHQVVIESLKSWVAREKRSAAGGGDGKQ